VLQSLSENDSYRILRYRDPLEEGEMIFSTQAMNQRDSVRYGVYSFYPSPDDRYLALQMDKDGDDWMEIYLFDIEAQQVTEYLDATMSFFPSWIDGESLFYTQINQTDDPNEFFSNIKVKYHQLGTDQSEDQVLLSKDSNSAIDYQAGDFPSFSVLPDGQHVQCAIARGVSPYPKSYIAPLSQVLESSTATHWQLSYDFDDKVIQDGADSSFLYMLSSQDTEAGKITRMTFTNPTEHQVVLAAPENGYLKDMKITPKTVYAEIIKNGLSTLWDVNQNQPIPLPFQGSIDLHESGSSATAYGETLLFGLSNWSHGYGIYYYDESKGQVVPTNMRPAGPYDTPENLAVEETTVTSHDGALVPVSIIYNKTTKRDGDSPAIIEVYGAYGESLAPYLSVEMLAWYNRGGILAVAHVRGGGEKGTAWHEAGKLSRKENSWKDLIAVAQYLVDEQYSTPEKLGVMGGSAGGITVGRAITEQPDLFAAAVLEFPSLNPTRLDQQTDGYLQEDEFGSPSDSAAFGYLHRMDVYHHVASGQDYPALLFTAGRDDPRIPLWEPAKVAAKFETRRANDQPTLFRVYEGGHGNSASDEEVRMLADKFAFFAWQLEANSTSQPSVPTGQE